jgi:hypothetical protein
MKAFTGLKVEEFNNIFETFSKEIDDIKWKKYKKEKDTRQRKPGGGAKGKLCTAEIKLLFILMYFKCYPTMDVMGIFFDLDRANVKRNVDSLTPILEKVLGQKQSLPRRKIHSLKEFLELISEAKDLFVDGTERPIQRPKNRKKQRKYFSGKKKQHTVKNIVINDDKRKIKYLGSTKIGKDHDYSMFKKEISPPNISKNTTLWTDKGFQGIQKDYPSLDVMMPKKKPKGKDLSQFDKEQNKTISGIRVLSEHAISGIKRFRILTDKFRNKSRHFNDKAIFISCGLWNYHLDNC